MTNPYDHDPFAVLKLDPAATPEEVVAQAGRLRQRAAGEEELTRIREAVRALTGRAEDRWWHEWLSHPGPCHSWPALERFRAAFRRSPQVPDEAPAAAPPPDPAESARLLRALLVDEFPA